MNGIQVFKFDQVPVPFQDDGYLNATAIAEHFGKRVNSYLRNKTTKDYIAALAETLSNPEARIRVSKGNQLVIIRKGGETRLQGTWLHPKLAVDFARWLNPKFSVWCDAQIELLLKGKLPDITGLMSNLEDLMSKVEGLTKTVEALQATVDELSKPEPLEDFLPERDVVRNLHFGEQIQVVMLGKPVTMTLLSDGVFVLAEQLIEACGMSWRYHRQQIKDKPWVKELWLRQLPEPWVFLPEALAYLRRSFNAKPKFELGYVASALEIYTPKFMPLLHETTKPI